MTVPPEDNGWSRNQTGTQPGMTKGKRVRVILGHGQEAKGDWPADPPTRWTITGSKYDITHWRLT